MSPMLGQSMYPSATIGVPCLPVSRQCEDRLCSRSVSQPQWSPSAHVGGRPRWLLRPDVDAQQAARLARLRWVHELRMQRYDEAAETLLHVSADPSVSSRCLRLACSTRSKQ